MIASIHRTYLAEEVVQSSAMDCGPAALKSLLAGFGISVGYDRLRDACQTDVDGTSIDTLEALANQLGLQAEQVMLPCDFLEIPEAAALPAIVIVQRPQGGTHFIVLWRRLGPLVQVMDPASGRRWMTWQRLRDELYQHEAEVPLTSWQEWARSDGFVRVLRARLRRLGIAARPLLDDVLTIPDATAVCTFDAALRSVEALCRARAIAPGHEAERVLADRLAAAAGGRAVLAKEWYVAEPQVDPQGHVESIRVRGAVLVRALGRGAAPATPSRTEPIEISPLLRGAQHERPCRPFRDLFALLGASPWQRWPPLGFLGFGAVLYSLAGTAEALLLRSLLEVGPQLGVWTQRLALSAMVMLLAIGMLLLGYALHAYAQALGRRIEISLRVALFRKLQQLPDRYFHSRPLSDVAERAHQLHLTHEVPSLLSEAMQAGSLIVITTLTLLWLEPAASRSILLLALVVLGPPLAFLPMLKERDLRVRIHQGALGVFFLDALRGLIPLRAHGAEPAVRIEQEGLLVEWSRARSRLTRSVIWLAGGVPLLAAFVLGMLWMQAGERPRPVGTLLLLLYFSLSLPAQGQRLAQVARLYPVLRNTLFRLLEPLRANGLPNPALLPETKQVAVQSGPGVALRFVGVGVQRAGRMVLSEIELDVPAGSHVAIVGSSGAGKSSLLSLLLGFHEPASGVLEVEGRVLGPAELAALREQTAWLDPQVQLWNRSLLANLCFGQSHVPADLDPLLQAASLRSLLSRLPDGLSTQLGESGACVSGGEGQRVRMGRALLRSDARLVLLDEPFRGLDRQQRAELLARTRAAFEQATLLCVTHDIAATLTFPRVLVIEEGRLVEDADPAELQARPGSRYAALLAAEDSARRTIFESPMWRHLRLDNGSLDANGASS